MFWKAGFGVPMAPPSNVVKRDSAVSTISGRCPEVQPCFAVLCLSVLCAVLLSLFLSCFYMASFVLKPVPSYGASITWVLGVPGGGATVKSMHVQTFLSSGTYAPGCPSGSLVYALAEVQAAGGTPLGDNFYGGGGAGGYAEKLLTAAQIGASQSVTVGTAGSAGNAGGSSSFGAFVSCTGGGSVSIQYGPGGDGGTCAGGDMTIAGAAGYSHNQPTSANESGNGGNSYWGSGATGVVDYDGLYDTGGPAGGYGAGGAAEFGDGCGGGACASDGYVWKGTSGIVKVTEFCSQ